MADRRKPHDVNLGVSISASPRVQAIAVVIAAMIVSAMLLMLNAAMS